MPSDTQIGATVAIVVLIIFLLGYAVNKGWIWKSATAPRGQTALTAPCPSPPPCPTTKCPTCPTCPTCQPCETCKPCPPCPSATSTEGPSVKPSDESMTDGDLNLPISRTPVDTYTNKPQPPQPTKQKPQQQPAPWENILDMDGLSSLGWRQPSSVPLDWEPTDVVWIVRYYYSPLCSYCTELTPEWNKMVNRFAQDNRFRFEVIDGLSSEGKKILDKVRVNGQPIQGFPALTLGNGKDSNEKLLQSGVTNAREPVLTQKLNQMVAPPKYYLNSPSVPSDASSSLSARGTSGTSGSFSSSPSAQYS